MQKATTLVFALVSLLIGGCGSPSEPSQGDPSADSLDACNPNVPSTIEEVALDHATNRRMKDVRICATPVDGSASETCGLSGADGLLALSVPSCRDYRVTFTFDGYLGANQLLRIHGAAETGARMLSHRTASQFADVLGTQLDLTKAQPAAIAYDDQGYAFRGLSLRLGPANGTPYYLQATGAPSGSLTATTAAGIGGFFNTTPGAYMMYAGVPAGVTCDTAAYVPGDAPNSVKLEALAGSIAISRFDCHTK